VNNGKFGERWVKMPAAFGLDVVEIRIPWGEAVQPDRMLEVLKENPDAKAVYVVHSETSTGAATDVRELARVIREHSSALIVVDGITAIGALEFRLDQWGIDACVTGSQKGLMIPPGLAFVALGERARAALTKATMPRFYLSLQKALDAHRKNDTPWTPAVSLVVGVDEALRLIREEGIENVWARHERLASALRAGITAIGLRAFSAQPSNAVTAVWVPEGVDWKQFNRHLKVENGITIAGGQDEFSGRIFRVSHLGYYDDLDMVTVMSAIERSLAKQGFGFSAGAGVAAVHNSLLERMK
jgi:aspartate aminotransferase-like enzyme